MTLFIDAAEYIYSVTPSTGVRMLVHNQNQHPFMYDEGFDLKTGQRTVIKLRKAAFCCYFHNFLQFLVCSLLESAYNTCADSKALPQGPVTNCCFHEKYLNVFGARIKHMAW